MFLLRPPGVYEPQGDTRLLYEALRRAPVPVGARVLDLCSGTGVLALAAARMGAAHVEAVDVSWTAMLAAWCNARAHGLPVTVRRGNCLDTAPGRRFDVVIANPPYVPCPDVRPSSRGRARACDGGWDGRAVLDRLCDRASDLLEPGGMLLLVHSALCDAELTLTRLRDAGLKAAVVARRRQPFGPVLIDRASWLEERGFIARGQRDEELVVVRADRAVQRAR